MTTEATDLDRLVSSLGMDARLETSATPDELAPPFLSSLHHFVRDGLGDWVGFVVDLKAYGRLVVAAPADIPEAGCSIWFRKTEYLNAQIVAGLIAELARKADPVFMSSDGDPIAAQSLNAVGVATVTLESSDRRRRTLGTLGASFVQASRG